MVVIVDYSLNKHLAISGLQKIVCNLIYFPFVFLHTAFSQSFNRQILLIFLDLVPEGKLLFIRM